MAVGFAIMALGLFILSLSSSFFTAFFSFLLVGLGMSLYNPTANSAISELFSTRKGFAINVLHVFFGIGAMTGPLLSGVILQFFNSWRLAFQLYPILCIAILISILIIPTGLPPPPRKRTLENIAMVLRSRVVLFLSVATFLELAAEYGLTMWFVYFLINYRGLPLMESSIILGSMGGVFIPARLFWSRYVDRIGYARTLGLCGVLGSTLLAASLLSPSPVVTMLTFPAAAFLFSATIPAATALAASEFPEASGAAIGALYLSGAVGGVVGPLTIGAVSEASTNLFGILTIPAFLAIITVVAMGLKSTGEKEIC